MHRSAVLAAQMETLRTELLTREALEEPSEEQVQRAEAILTEFGTVEEQHRAAAAHEAEVERVRSLAINQSETRVPVAKDGILVNVLSSRTDLAEANARLRASSDERARHMLETTHQLKAPFAAIHAQAQLLLGNYCGPLPAAAQSVVEKISSRCMALSRQIQEMLQLANLQSQGQAPPAPRELDLGTLVEDAIARVEPAARQRGIRIEREIQSVTVTAVVDHLTMLLDNVVINAVTYSYNNGLVQVTCQARHSGDAMVVVRDHGIGIPPDKLPRVFDGPFRSCWSSTGLIPDSRSWSSRGTSAIRRRSPLG